MRKILNAALKIFNLLKPSGNYISQLFEQSLTLRLVFFSLPTAIIFLNRINQLILVTLKCGVLFEVRTEFLNII
jgi:hypothetical protein